MDKSPDLYLERDLPAIREMLGGSSPSVVACREPFHKARFLDEVVRSAGCPVVLVDTDLLYTGYLGASMIRGVPGLSVVRPDAGGWRRALADAAVRASAERILVIIDTCNGAYNMSDGAEAVRLVNSSIMLLACAGRSAGSSVIVCAMARRREDGRWVLSPGGRQIMGSGGTGVFLLEGRGDGLRVSRLAGGPGQTPL